MEAAVSVLKSKTVWFGIAQLCWTAFQAYATGGSLTPDAVATLFGGIGSILFRALTTKPLLEK